ncbi:unnamed protein product [Rhodiola kirilowii]
MDGKKTKISDLPSNIIECILARLPIRDAVATSVLCKEWRHKWTRIPNLVFDNEFVINLIRFQDKRQLGLPSAIMLRHFRTNEYSDIIGKIMLRHIGPIHKFVLYIPPFCNDLHFNLLSWMQFISQKDVKELTIQARSAQIKLPSYIFNCRELQSFEIHVCGLDLHPPLDFVGFCNLRRLDLSGLLNGTQISNLISKCPLLERLSINRVADGHTLTTEMGSKQIITDISLPDRISDLPSDIISFILDRLSVREAVATSILSKDWRHKWRRIGNLIFDEEFLVDVISHRIEGDNKRIDLEYNNIIRRILLLHLGPVRKFVLLIPSFDYYHSPKLRLPPDIFHCNELQHLKLDVYTLDLLPPQDFRGFCNLISLDLIVSKDEGVIGNLISNCPVLERLSVNCLACRQPLVIDAPRLRFLTVCIYMNSDVLFTLKNGHGVADISLDFVGCRDRCIRAKCRDRCSLPPPTDISSVPMSLPTTLHNHKSLTLLDVDISSLEHIYFVLCVLKNSPNLQMLNLAKLANEDEDALHLLDMQTRETHTLKSLLTVKINRFFGSKTGIKFIKLILSCSPILKTLFLTGEYTLNEEEFILMSELLQCPRSSSRAQVIYSRYPGDSSIFDF